jgi:UDP-N-acetylmuramyl tripeptide synthase
VSTGRTIHRNPAAAARRALAVATGKAARRGVRLLGRGNGTAIPGLLTLTIDPGALASLVAEIAGGTVMVTGSNGKGTTCRMLAQVMREAGLHPVINTEGSNQRSGLATTMVAHAGYAGHLPADASAIGLFEVDEGSFPEILRQVGRPRAIVFTNIFRDQLDRYFEPAYIKALLERAMRHLPSDTTLVLNADDPRVAWLAPELPNPRLYFGMADASVARAHADPTSDFPRCPRCGGELAYDVVFFAHLGHWACTSCGLARPQPQVSATKIELTGPSATRLQVVTPAADTVLDVPLPGLYNAYNALAAVAAATQCELPDRSFAAIGKVTAGSIRMERVQVPGHDVYLVLAKNANGYTEVLRAVLCDGEPRRMLLGLNDCPGKQPDTSWIWDVDFDGLTGMVPAPVVTGNRAADLAVRLKYAGWLGDSEHPDVLAEPDPVRAFQAALDQTPAGQPLWIVSTSVVLMEIRSWMRQHGYVREMWRDHDRPQAARPVRPARPGRGRLAGLRPAPSAEVLAETVLSEAVLSETVRSQPHLSRTVVTVPSIDALALTEPALTDAALTEPSMTDPALTDAALTDPALTEPARTDPALTERVVTEPELTAAGLTTGGPAGQPPDPLGPDAEVLDAGAGSMLTADPLPAGPGASGAAAPDVAEPGVAARNLTKKARRRSRSGVTR